MLITNTGGIGMHPSAGNSKDFYLGQSQLSMKNNSMAQILPYKNLNAASISEKDIQVAAARA